MTQPTLVAKGTAEPFFAGASNPGRERPFWALSRLRESLAGARDAALEPVRVTWWGMACLLPYLMTRDEAMRAALLKRLLLRLGPLYIKAGQVLGTQSALLPKRALEEFRSLFSDLEPMPLDALRRVLAAAFDRPIQAVFRDFDGTPVAVGSVAQVHRAVLADGRQVAVKVVKAGVRRRLDASARCLAAALRALHVVSPSLRRHDAPAHFAELRPILIGQCDMLEEARRQRRIADNFAGHPFVRVPEPCLELCTSDVLVMEWLDGTRGQDHENIATDQLQLAGRLQEMFYCMAYFHGQFHVDPHPGNMLFGPDGEIRLLDFGLVGELSEDDKWGLTGFYYACSRGDWAAAVNRFTRTFAVWADGTGPAADSGYQGELLAILRKHFEERSARWSTMSFLGDAAAVLRRHGGRVSTRFSLLALALLTGEGFLSLVDPGIDIWANARKFTDRFSPYMSEGVRAQFEREFAILIPRTIARRQRAKASLIAPTHLDRYVLPSAFPLIVDRAQGCRIHDIDGRAYIDLSCGYGPHILGYAHPSVVQAVAEAAQRGAVNALASSSELELAERIAEPFGTGARVVFGNSGTEAVMMAVRIARAHTGRDRIAKFEGHYHGSSDQGMVSSWFRFSGDPRRPSPVSGSPGSHRASVEETLVLQYGDPEALSVIREHALSLACVLVEPMPTALADLDHEFLRALRATCTEAGVLLVFDEVVTGFRVTYGGAQHLAGVQPDLTCLGKVIGGGLPCGAVVGKAEILEIARSSGDPIRDVEERAFVGGTMSGNSVTCAAGLAALDHLRAHPDIYRELQRKTSVLGAALESAAARRGVPCDVKASRSIFSVTFGHARPKRIRDRLAGSNFKANVALAYYMRKHGVYMPELHTMLLSAAHADSDLEVVADTFARSLDEMMRDGLFAL